LLIEKEGIDLILPTHDTILVFMAKNSEKINTKIAVAGVTQAEICRSKKKIYSLFQEFDFCPTVFESFEEIKAFPVYAKLDEGQGSKGAFIVHERKQFDELKDPENYVITEFLPGEELTIDCFTDRHGNLQFVGPRIRKRVFDGVCVNSITVDATDEIKAIGKIVSDQIKYSWLMVFPIKTGCQWEI
jgi:carbamoylphosphate synthase large subunit